MVLLVLILVHHSHVDSRRNVVHASLIHISSTLRLLPVVHHLKIEHQVGPTTCCSCWHLGPTAALNLLASHLQIDSLVASLHWSIEIHRILTNGLHPEIDRGTMEGKHLLVRLLQLEII